MSFPTADESALVVLAACLPSLRSPPVMPRECAASRLDLVALPVSSLQRGAPARGVGRAVAGPYEGPAPLGAAFGPTACGRRTRNRLRLQSARMPANT